MKEMEQDNKKIEFDKIAFLFCVVIMFSIIVRLIYDISCEPEIEIKLNHAEINSKLEKKVDFAYLSDLDIEYNAREKNLFLNGIYKGEIFGKAIYSDKHERSRSIFYCRIENIENRADSIVISIKEKYAQSGDINRSDLLHCVVRLLYGIELEVENTKQKNIKKVQKDLQKELNRKSLGAAG